MNNILIIPARGGSKRIPRKNIKLFKGKPIIERIITKFIELDIFKKVIVSTDDEEIASISSNAGAEIPFLRPKDISGDFISTREVILHAIEWFKSNSLEFDYVACLYPTAIFCQPEDLIKGMRILRELKNDTYVFSATKYPHPIQRAFFIDNKNFSKMIYPNNFFKRTQDLEKSYYDAGQFYLASSKTWVKKINFFDEAKPLVIPRLRAIDIDTYEDWEFAEILYELIIKEKIS